MGCHTQPMMTGNTTTFQERLSKLLDQYGLAELQRNASVLAPVADCGAVHRHVGIRVQKRSGRTQQQWNADQLTFTFECR